MNPRDRIVSNIMQTDAATAKQSDVLSVDQLLRLRWLRDMPVVDGEKLVGIVSIGDLLRTCIERFRSNPLDATSESVSLRIADVMVRDVISIDPDATLGEAAELMKFQQIAFLPVMDSQGRMLGTVSESDLVGATLR